MNQAALDFGALAVEVRGNETVSDCSVGFAYGAGGNRRFFAGAFLGDAMGGAILFAMIAGMACIVYTIDNRE